MASTTNLLCLFCLIVAHLPTPARGAACENEFDLAFVLDVSGSVGSRGWNQQLDFVRDMSARFPKAIISLAYFNNNAKLAFVNERDHSEVMAQLDSLRRNVSPGGGTSIGSGIQAITKAINTSDRMKVMIVSTDGDDSPTSIWGGNSDVTHKAAARARDAGFIIAAIGVRNQSLKRSTLEDVATTTDYVYMVDDYSHLDQQIDSLVDRTCVVVSEVDHPSICTGESPVLSVRGRGFDNAHTLSAATCRVTTADATYQAPATIVSPDLIECHLPEILEVGSYDFEISLDGKTYTGTEGVTMEVSACVSPLPMFLTVGAALCCAPLLLYAAILLLWAVVSGLCTVWNFLFAQQQVEVELYEPLDGGKLGEGKWAPVDTSHYVWSRSGGTARPLSVRWGPLGDTPSAPRDKGAFFFARIDEDDAVAVSIANTFGSPDDQPRGCCASVKEAFGRVLLLLWIICRPVVRIVRAMCCCCCRPCRKSNAPTPAEAAVLV